MSAVRQTLSFVDRAGVAILAVVTAVTLLLLIGPSLVVVATAFEPRPIISFPPSGVSLRWFEAALANETLRGALFTSLRLSAMVVLGTLVLGVPAAIALVRGNFRGKAAVNAFLLSPQMIPGMVIGVGLLFVGAYVGLRASELTFVIGLTAFCLPFTVRITMGGLANLDPRLDDASANLGAGHIETFLRVTLPQLLPVLLAAAAFTFIETFDNVSVSLFASGIDRRPLAVELYNLMRYDSSPMVAAISSLEIFFSFIVVLLVTWAAGPSVFER